mgnify:FL=1
MKIAITAKDQKLDAEVDPRFGRCGNFLFVDTETMEFKSFENEAKDAPSGAGVQSAQFVVDKDVDALLTGRVGPKALRGLKAGNQKIYTGLSGTVAQAIEQFKNNELEELVEEEV